MAESPAKKGKPPAADNTAAKQLRPFCFQPGQSGNLKGRPKGSRNKLGEDFLTALQMDFAEHGPAIIAKVREDRPHEYLKVVAGLLPKELNVKTSPLENLSDDELEASIRVLLQLAAGAGNDPDTETKH